MRRFTRPPFRYDRTTADARQSDIPSQHMAVGDPYSNEYQADIGSLGFDGSQEGFAGGESNLTDQAGGGPSAPGGPGAGQSGASFVRHTFDSRPVLARDFVSQTYPTNLGQPNDPNGTFTVPTGFVALVREIFYLPNLGGTTCDVTGKPNNTYSATVFVNGVPVPQYTNFDISNLYPGGGSFECFLLLNAGDKITGAVRFGGNDVTGTNSAGSAGFAFYGNLLVNDGRDLPQYAGNRDCEPVCLDASSIAQIKPPPLVIPGQPTPTNPTGAIVVTRPPCPRPPAVSVNDYLACVIANGGPG